MDYIEVRVRYQAGLVCGDGIMAGGESCDDGNTLDGDGCAADCGVVPPVCGDGTQQYGEVCEDGGLVDGDGCDSNCTPTACGNGIVTPGEDCDDGNLADGDGCSADCTLPTMSCGTATSITSNIDGSTITRTTVGALSDQTEWCAHTPLGPAGEVVYSITPTLDGIITAETLSVGTNFDPVLSVRSTCVDADTWIVCNNDSLGLMPSVSFSASAGSTYYLLVDGYGTSEGTFELSLRQTYDIAAPASSIVLSGSIDSSDPTWAMLDETCVRPSSGQHPYSYHTVATDTAELLDITATWQGGKDGYLHVFTKAGEPPIGCIIGNDDLVDATQSQLLGISIDPFERLTIVVSGAAPDDAIGAYTLDVATQ